MFDTALMSLVGAGPHIQASSNLLILPSSLDVHFCLGKAQMTIRRFRLSFRSLLRNTDPTTTECRGMGRSTR